MFGQLMEMGVCARCKVTVVDYGRLNIDGSPHICAWKERLPVIPCPYCAEYIFANGFSKLDWWNGKLHECKGGVMKIHSTDCPCAKCLSECLVEKRDQAIYDAMDQTADLLYKISDTETRALGELKKNTGTLNSIGGWRLWDKESSTWIEYRPVPESVGFVTPPKGVNSLQGYGLCYWRYVGAETAEEADKYLEEMLNSVPGFGVTGQEIEARIQSADPSVKKPEDQHFSYAFVLTVSAIIVAMIIIHLVTGFGAW
jgi:hypothetical protein